MTKQIYWDLANQGVSFYKILQMRNKVTLQTANLMIVLGQLINRVNDATSDASFKLEKITPIVNKLQEYSLVTSKLGEMFLLSTFGMGALSSMALEADEAQASGLQKVLSGPSKLPMILGLNKDSAQLWLSGYRSVASAGIVIYCLQAFFSANTGIYNSKTDKVSAIIDAEQEISNLISNSENKASQTIQSIAKSDEKAIENDFDSSTKQIYYNN